MEVHTPHEPVTSLRGLVTHLSLVIVGVLIALSFEGVATWREHRALVRDARANLLKEVRDNRKALDERLKRIPTEIDQLDRALEVSTALLQHKAIDGQMDLGFKSAELQTASHTTAEITGAFALMEYDEVKRYASLYNRQNVFVKTQDQATQDLTPARRSACAAAEPWSLSGWRSPPAARTLSCRSGEWPSPTPRPAGHPSLDVR